MLWDTGPCRYRASALLAGLAFGSETAPAELILTHGVNFNEAEVRNDEEGLKTLGRTLVEVACGGRGRAAAHARGRS